LNDVSAVGALVVTGALATGAGADTGVGALATGKFITGSGGGLLIAATFSCPRVHAAIPKIAPMEI
jgi:hypothetical protein